jgi:hypothetical protein
MVNVTDDFFDHPHITVRDCRDNDGRNVTSMTNSSHAVPLAWLLASSSQYFSLMVAKSRIPKISARQSVYGVFPTYLGSEWLVSVKPPINCHARRPSEINEQSFSMYVLKHRRVTTRRSL